MDQFRTAIRLQPGVPITHQSKLFTTGSCFADLLGSKLNESRFRATINPFGVSYNPLSIHKQLQAALRKQRPAPELYVQSEGAFRHHDYHSHLRAKTLNSLASLLQERIAEAGSELRNTDILIITYGTSWVYRHKTSTEVVNNCHKVPAREFDKSLLDPADIVRSFGSLYAELKGHSPGARVILTVSPVRHLRDNLVLNQLSKAGLIIACHKIMQQFKDVEYFPAYEIMMDDLRDYRFYDRDMIHPSAVAVDYIWEKFREKYFRPETMAVTDRCHELTRALAHRPFDAASNEYRNFLLRTLDLAKEIADQANVKADIDELESRLSTFAQLK